jgi:hypothetical protein
METVVVNRKTQDFDVYIGRGSKWGNDFSHREGTKALVLVRTREEAIARYRIDLWRKIKAGEITLDDLADLHGKRLGCYCAPLPCHGDVLVAAAAWADEQLFLRAEHEALYPESQGI